MAFPDQSSGATRSICTHMTRIHLPLPAVSPTSPSVNNVVHTKSTPVHSGVRGSGKYRSLRTNNGRMSRNEGYHVIQRQKLPLIRSYRSRLNHFPFWVDDAVNVHSQTYQIWKLPVCYPFSLLTVVVFDGKSNGDTLRSPFLGFDIEYVSK